ncbi:MAG: aminotransferase class III-fold pyridoxal phosphate-dependent enzyme [Bacteroidetes bacterium]|nr:aminotransferase class III-fold pyridoxal phosphate-dependent enzyme [Bacteroidota bacterium]
MTFYIEQISQLVKNFYNIDANITWLAGYDEQNFLLQTTAQEKFILKVSQDNFPFIEAQTEVLDLLAKSSLRNNFQKQIPNIKGETITIVEWDGKKYFIRILSFLEGKFWVDEKNKTEALCENLGSFLGKMDAVMQGYFHPAIERQYLWDISEATLAEKKLHFIKDHEKRRIANYFLLQYQMEALPVIQGLRKACIHNDANDYNVLVNDDAVTGLIDFGDMVYSALINNVAVACTYSMLHSDDPLTVAKQVVKGYHEVNPLTVEETDILYYLIAARLCISVTQSAYFASLNSNNKHHFITEQPAWKLLFQLIQINPIKAADAFRNVCGFAPLIDVNDDYKNLLQDRDDVIGRNLSISYKKHLKIVRGALQYLYDDKGNTFIDCVNNVSHVGHCHPVVVRAMQKQIATLNTNTRYLNDVIIDYAKALTATLPSKLKVCYFTNSGSEANDLAIRMARHYTQRNDVIVLDHAYHGTSTLAIEMSPYKFDSKGGSGQKPYIHKALSPDLYRGKFQYDDKDAGEKYAASVLEILQQLKEKKTPAAAFICETILGVGGQIPLPENYLKNVYEHVHSFGGVCIADEVQVGFGRVGEKFWGFELQNAEPDIVVLGKPIGNGHPLAAVVVTDAIADAFNNGLEYFNTYGGNPVSMVTGLSVLNVIKDEQLQKNALETGNFLMEALKLLMKKYPIISDVRGHGLFIGAEMVKDHQTKEPAIPEIDFVVEKMKGRGFLLSTDGPLHNVLKIKPPIVFNKENAKALADNLDEVLGELH